MSNPQQATATILIASNNVTDAALIKKLLEAEFNNVFVSIAPDRIMEEFELRRPNVLVLAFDALEKSEHYYLDLCKLSDKARLQAYRTIILCDKNDISRAYLLCKMEHFHDYVFFLADDTRCTAATHVSASRAARTYSARSQPDSS